MKILVSILTVLLSQMAQASFLDHCEFQVEVTEVGAILPQTADQPNYALKVKGNVLSVKDLGGHTDCSFHVGQDYEMDLVSAGLINLALIKVGYKIPVEYFHVNNLTPNGVYDRTSFTLVSKAQEAFQAVLNSKLVFHKIRDLMQKLNSTDEPVVLLAGEAQSLQENFCGFAGCSSVFLVSLTYGEDYMNSPRDTVLAKVIIAALGEQITVELLN